MMIPLRTLTTRGANQRRLPCSVGRWLLAPLCLLVIAAAGCTDLLVDPSPSSASLNVSLSVDEQVSPDGPGDAFDKADAIYIRVEREGVPTVEELRPFTPAGPETTVSLTVDLNAAEEPATIVIELRLGSAVLFRAAQSVLLRAGTSPTLDISLSPIFSGVNITSVDSLLFASLGETAQVAASVVFASGDLMPGVPITWSSSNAAVASVTQQGIVTAHRDGDASIRAAYGDLSDEVRVRVRQAVASVRVNPPTATLEVGAALQLTVTLRDALGNLVAHPPASAWTSSNTSVSVNSAGVATARSPGTATISATVSGRIGRSDIVVPQPPPVALFDGWWSGAMYDVEYPQYYFYDVQLFVDQEGNNARGEVGWQFGAQTLDVGVGADYEWQQYRNGVINDRSIVFSFESESDGTVLYTFELTLSPNGQQLEGQLTECFSSSCFYYHVYLQRAAAKAVRGAAAAALVTAAAGVFPED